MPNLASSGSRMGQGAKHGHVWRAGQGGVSMQAGGQMGLTSLPCLLLVLAKCSRAFRYEMAEDPITEKVMLACTILLAFLKQPPTVTGSSHIQQEEQDHAFQIFTMQQKGWYQPQQGAPRGEGILLPLIVFAAPSAGNDYCL